MAAVVQQLQTNPGLFDGLYGFCGHHFKPDGTLYIGNITKNGQCAGKINATSPPIPGGADMLAEAKRQQIDFQPVITLEDPFAAMNNTAPYIASFAAMAKKEGWKGFNLDWEGKNTTSTKELFLNFCQLMNDFADGLEKHGLTFSTDVQWVTQWTKGPEDMTELTALLSSGHAKWITMDTYYYSTGRVVDALDFYATRVSPSHLSVGMSSNSIVNQDGFVARMHALREYHISDVTMFMLPTAELWMPWLRKWKNDCAGCPGGGTLSCFAHEACY